MAFALHIYTRGQNGKVSSRHTFYGATEDKAEELADSHAEECEELGTLIDNEDEIEIVEEIAEIPGIAALEEAAAAQEGDDDAEEP
jgi:predicted ArsR family transcriptional regulator